MCVCFTRSSLSCSPTITLRGVLLGSYMIVCLFYPIIIIMFTYYYSEGGSARVLYDCVFVLRRSSLSCSPTITLRGVLLGSYMIVCLFYPIIIIMFTYYYSEGGSARVLYDCVFVLPDHHYHVHLLLLWGGFC